jgi:hypothetical protein
MSLMVPGRPRRRPPFVSVVAALLAATAAAALAPGCGARTGLDVPLPDPPPPECETFEDCEGAEDLCNPVGCELEERVRPEDGRRYLVGTCVPLEPPDCDDGDECSTDSCAPTTGQCEHAPASIDADGDGFRGPRAGFSAGEEGACGDDCDDTSALAYPGAVEVCDGVDNDCNGVVDDGASWLPLDLEPIRLSNDGAAPASVGSVAWSGAEWLATFNVEGPDGQEMVRSRLAPDGLELTPADAHVSEVNADTFTGPVVWAGDRFASAWSDRRFGDYEVYFALFAPNGDKITPDTRLSFGPAFSLYPDVAWTGQEFVVAWQDERSGAFEIRAQRLDRDGQLVGGETAVVSSALNAVELPVLAATSLGTALVYGTGGTDDRRVAFTVLEPDLTPRFEPILLTDGTAKAWLQTVVANDDEYVVSWVEEGADGSAIVAAVLDQRGALVLEPRRVVDPGPGRFARYPTIRALGDRMLLVYSDDRAGDGYELWARLLDAELRPIEDERRITTAPGTTAYPRTAFGPDGNLGVLFRDDRLGEHHVWFTRLGCAVSQIPDGERAPGG